MQNWTFHCFYNNFVIFIASIPGRIYLLQENSNHLLGCVIWFQWTACHHEELCYCSILWSTDMFKHFHKFFSKISLQLLLYSNRVFVHSMTWTYMAVSLWKYWKWTIQQPEINWSWYSKKNYHPGFNLMARDLYFTILVEVFMNHIE